ncbi:MAG: tripartite tricarboxylate transporter substrate binding protein [Betaproteobacteria bacterium]|nr:MAG: tripartite tricarboxylate transporter substrate binding protein [Betaproteobacteria bacterium]
MRAPSASPTRTSTGSASVRGSRVKSLLSGAVLVLAAFAAGTSFSQTYPAKPVRIVAPFAPGGGTDFIARLIAQKLTERLGQQVIVENKPGAGGNLGAEFAVKSAPDGYTLLLIAGSYTVNPSIYKLSFDPVNDISPIVQLSQGPFVVAVHPSVPAKTLKELIEYARREPDKLSYASAGSGSITHLASELFLDMAKIKMVHVPYKGTGPALNDTIAGNTQLIFGSVATSLQFIKSGRLRGLAVTTPQRIQAAPELPTVSEAGVPGYQVVLWHGLVGPKGLPGAVVERVNQAANDALKSKDVADLLATDGVAPAGGTPEQFRAVIKSDIERWSGVVKQANIKAD